ncbi:hypothetical protein, partial, partial [Absidia glauca]
SNTSSNGTGKLCAKRGCGAPYTDDHNEVCDFKNANVDWDLMRANQRIDRSRAAANKTTSGKSTSHKHARAANKPAAKSTSRQAVRSSRPPSTSSSAKSASSPPTTARPWGDHQTVIQMQDELTRQAQAALLEDLEMDFVQEQAGALSLSTDSPIDKMD